jgi:hypothetical protein
MSDALNDAEVLCMARVNDPNARVAQTAKAGVALAAELNLSRRFMLAFSSAITCGPRPSPGQLAGHLEILARKGAKVWLAASGEPEPEWLETPAIDALIARVEAAEAELETLRG